MQTKHPETYDQSRKITVDKWLKALALSPGILFTAGYLVIYLLTNAYLNRELKVSISEAIGSATENRYTLSIEQLRAGLDLHSVTVQYLELTPVMKTQHHAAANGSVSIRELCIDDLDLCNLLFSKESAEHSTREISRLILAAEKHFVFSPSQ